MVSRIKNIIKWFPILWKQRDWDYGYAIDVFIFQLSKIADNFDSGKSYSIGSEARASQIRRVVKLMKKVYDEEFELDYSDQIEAKYGKNNWVFNPTQEQREKGIINRVFEKNYSKEELKQIYEDERKIILQCSEKQEKAHKLVWKLVENYIRDWWD